MKIQCKERGGPVVREVVRIWEPNELRRLIPSMLKVPSFLQGMSVPEIDSLITARDAAVYRVDDVGVLAVLEIEEGLAAHAHITFWDGRMRGREGLCRTLARCTMRFYSLKALFTAVPCESAAVIAFARRVGFKMLGSANGVTLLQLSYEDVSR